MKKIVITSLLGVCLVSACAHNLQGGPDARHGIGGFFKGVAHLVLSPIQIASGLLEGVASLPYYASTGLHAINEGMVNAQASITLDDTYEAAYGKRIDEVNADGDTNERFRRMKHATEYFQKVLKQYGVVDYQYYYLTSIDTANKDGATLFAVIYRTSDSITVLDKYDNKTQRRFTSSDRLFYEPFMVDIHGNPLDVIIDWAGVPIEAYASQKQQAVLLTLSANAVATGKKRQDYWQIEKRWIEGDFQQIIKEQNAKVEQSMRI
jgi:hypothetical protein